MSVYFIHSEVLNGGNVVTKICAFATASSQKEAFDMLFGCNKVKGHESKGRNVVIDKFEEVE